MDDKICYFQSEMANKLQESVAMNVVMKESKTFPRIRYWNIYSAEIPPTQDSEDDFKAHYHSKVVDQNVLEDLEDEKIINAVPNMAKFYPIFTPADGNCLCHAVSLYLWGIPDTHHFLRRLLYVTLVTDENKLLQRLYLKHSANQQATGECFDSSIWGKSWDRLVTEAEEIPITAGSTHLEPLEAIHIFILANILSRPIIVLSSPVVRTVFEQTIQANNIGGIYLPLLCDPNETVKSPIVLGFNMNHFTPLMHMEKCPRIKAVPLQRMGLITLPVHFFQDLLPDNIAKKLQAYLNIDKKTESALIKATHLPKDQNIFHAHFERCKVLYENDKKRNAGRVTLKGTGQLNVDEFSEDFLGKHSDTIHIISSGLQETPSLCINNCGMYGSVELGNKCSKCFGIDSQSNVIPQRIAKPKPDRRTLNDNGLQQYTNEQILQYNYEQFGSAREASTSQKKSNKVPVGNYPRELTYSRSDHQSRESVNRNMSQDESTVFLPIAQKKDNFAESTLLTPIQKQRDQQFETMTLETATCITPGCRQKAHRKLQYRCPACFIQRSSKDPSLMSPVHQENDPRMAGNFRQCSEKPSEILLGQGPLGNPGNTNRAFRTQISSQESFLNPRIQNNFRQCSEKLPEMLSGQGAVGNPNNFNPAFRTQISSQDAFPNSRRADNVQQYSDKLPGMLSGQGAVGNSSNLNPAFRSEISSQVSPLNSEERQVSLLDLLCSEVNCPNRRISQLHPLCSSCSEKNERFYCSTPGCLNKAEQNSYAMCDSCYRNNESKRVMIPTQSIPDTKNHNTNNDYPRPSAPSFL